MFKNYVLRLILVQILSLSLLLSLTITVYYLFFCDLFSVTVMGLHDSDVFLSIIMNFTIITIFCCCCQCFCKLCQICCDKSIEKCFPEDQGNICIFIVPIDRSFPEDEGNICIFIVPK